MPRQLIIASVLALNAGFAYADVILKPTTGGVLVSHGQGFERVTGSQRLFDNFDTGLGS